MRVTVWVKNFSGSPRNYVIQPTYHIPGPYAHLQCVNNDAIGNVHCTYVKHAHEYDVATGVQNWCLQGMHC